MKPLLFLFLLFQMPTYQEMEVHSAAGLEDSREGAIRLVGALEEFKAVYLIELGALAETNEQLDASRALTLEIEDITDKARLLAERIGEIQQDLRDE